MGNCTAYNRKNQTVEAKHTAEAKIKKQATEKPKQHGGVFVLEHRNGQHSGHYSNRPHPKNGRDQPWCLLQNKNGQDFQNVGKPADYPVFCHVIFPRKKKKTPAPLPGLGTR